MFLQLGLNPHLNVGNIEKCPPKTQSLSWEEQSLILLRHYNLVIKVFLLIIVIRRLIIAVMHQVETSHLGTEIRMCCRWEEHGHVLGVGHFWGSFQVQCPQESCASLMAISSWFLEPAETVPVFVRGTHSQVLPLEPLRSPRVPTNHVCAHVSRRWFPCSCVHAASSSLGCIASLLHLWSHV